MVYSRQLNRVDLIQICPEASTQVRIIEWNSNE